MQISDKTNKEEMTISMHISDLTANQKMSKKIIVYPNEPKLQVELLLSIAFYQICAS